jgi:GH18 family chitinase
MMYDMHQPFNGISAGGKNDPLDVTGFNSALYPPDKEKYPVLASWGYNYDGTRGGIPAAISPRKFIKMGFSPSKVGMGVPFYGYIYSGKNAPNQPRGDVWPQYLSYADCIRASRIGGVRHWEDRAKVPWIGGIPNLDIGWIVKAGQQFYITYDDSASLTEKVRWAKQLGLGGVMIYELWTGWVSTEDQGRRDPLLRAVVRAIHEKP